MGTNLMNLASLVAVVVISGAAAAGVLIAMNPFPEELLFNRGDSAVPDDTSFDELIDATPAVHPQQEAQVTVLSDSSDIVRIAIDEAVEIDPSQPALGIGTRYLFPEIYSGLTRLSSRPVDTLELDLAERYEVWGGQTYVFTLRPDLKFSDGSPLTASDFKWSWERALAPATGSPIAMSVLGPVQGAAQFADGTSNELTGVEVIDELTLEIRLVRPRADFMYLLTHPVASVLKQSNVEQWDIDTAANQTEEIDQYPTPIGPVGTGPFRIALFENEGSILLERNPYYWDDPPHIDGVALIRGILTLDVDEWGDRLGDAFRASRIDVARYEWEGADETELAVFPQAPLTAFLAFNIKVPPFDDVEFRRALLYAADLNRWDEPLVSWVATRIIPPALNPGVSGGFSSSRDLRRLTDTNGAKTAIARSIYAADVENIGIELITQYEGTEVFFDAVFESWEEKLGVSGEIVEVSADEFAEMSARGEVPMTFHSIAPHYPDPHAVLGVFEGMYGDEDVPSEHAELESMITDALIEPDPERLRWQSDYIALHILDRALALPLFWNPSEVTWAVQPWVRGFEAAAYPRSVFKDVWFDETAPDRGLPK